ncbi:MAG: putative addiction module component (TIGR02574 family) [Verrucomicrobiales bacterium]|jgi:putative addiction module component (TIGR02574 family)
MTTIEEITNTARTLKPIERDQLIDSLIDAREAEQNAEIGRRIAEIDSGEVKGIPAEQVFAELRERLDAARK